jgi:hypothetical protein
MKITPYIPQLDLRPFNRYSLVTTLMGYWFLQESMSQTPGIVAGRVMKAKKIKP